MRTAAGTPIPATAAKPPTSHTHPQGRTVGPTTLPDHTSTLELQLRDANNALFMILLECCGMILEAEEPSSPTMSDAVLYAKNLRESGRAAMTNKEIADHSYQLAVELRSSGDAVITATRRVLTQLAAAERWGLQLP